MRSYCITGYGRPLEAVESKPPTPGEHEVLIRVTACGVCHSDLHYWHGEYNLGGGNAFTLEERGVSLPIVPGHEPIGVVEAVGSGVSEVEPGQTRLVYPWIGCGTCNQCDAGNDMNCNAMQTVGLFRPGGYATHLLVPHARYLVDVEGIPDTQACTLACAGLTAYSALKKVLPLDQGDVLVVIGAGGVGLTAIGISRIMGEHPVVAVDPDPDKRAAAESAGAARTGGAPITATELRDLAGGDIAAVLDFVGTAETAKLSLGVVRRGGKYVPVGLYGGLLETSLTPFPLRNVAMIGSLVGTLAELQELVALVRSRRWTPAPVQTRSLDEAQASLDDLEAGRVTGRIVLIPGTL